MPREFEAKVAIEGLSELLDSLKELPTVTGKNVLKRVARARLQPIADAASAKAPKRTGFLKAHIVVSPKLSAHQKSFDAVEGEYTIAMHAGVESSRASYYAHIDEFGSRHQRATPYMRPAWDEGKSGLTKDLAADLWAEIEKAANRLAKKAAKAKLLAQS